MTDLIPFLTHLAIFGGVIISVLLGSSLLTRVFASERRNDVPSMWS